VACLWYTVFLLHTLVLGNECTDGSIRLRGGTSVREGRVEICIEGRWGTICDNSWDSRDASVVCRQLNYSSLGKSTTFKPMTSVSTKMVLIYRSYFTHKCLLWTRKWANLA